MRSDSFLSPDTYIVTYTVDAGQTGIRLDAFLKEHYRKRSREALKRAITSGVITIARNQGAHVTVGRIKPSYPLLAGDEVRVLSERKPEPEVSFDYKVLYEDEGLLVIDKPAHLPVHPAGRYFFNTLLIHLRTNGHQNREISAEREFFLVHRIDKETSGVLVLAKDRESCAHLVRQFAERSTEKFYLAVVHGVPPAEFQVDAPLMRDPDSEIEVKMAVGTEEAGGMPSLTGFKRISTHTNAHGAFSLVECFPKTGRQHQIRVHLDHAGHPIVGDKLYGMPADEALRYFERKHLSPEAEARLLIKRHALHAAGIRFQHPRTGKRMEFRSELPRELQEFLGIEAKKEASGSGHPNLATESAIRS